MALEELSHVSGTHRLTALLLLSAASIIVSSLAGELGGIYVGVSLLLLAAAMRGYAALAALALSRTDALYTVRGNTAGEKLEVSIVLRNSSLVPIAFAELALMYSPSLRMLEGARAATAVLPPRGTVEYRVAFLGRTGRHRVGPLVAVVRDPLGLFRSTSITVAEPLDLRVVPRAERVRVRRLWVETRSTGITRAGEAGTGVEFYDVREYRPGDDIRRIVWRHLASSGKLTVRETEREAYQSVAFVVDASPAMFMGLYGATPFEHAARVVASIAAYLASRGDLVSLVVAGDKYTAAAPLARGRQAYMNTLKLLSDVPFEHEAGSGGSGLAKATTLLATMLPRERNLVFIFTSLREGAEHVEDLVEKLKRLGNEVYVAVPITTAYEVKGLPQWAQAVYRVKTFEQTRAELEAARRLRGKGVNVIALGPELLPQRIVAIIESRRA
ncbi:MAG: DUF58 domain-containing protein [Thermoproteota archaeon]